MIKNMTRGTNLPLVILLVAVLALTTATPVQAQGVAISGNFGSQHFQLIPGQSLNTPDIYVVIFNNGEEDIIARLIPDTPIGVDLILATTELTLSPGENQQVQVGLDIGPQVPPGEYDLILTAEVYREGEGIQLTGAAQLQAKLTVMAEAGEVAINTISPEGEDFIATIRLYKQVDGQNLSCGFSETGKLSTKLTPGDYLVEAAYEGVRVAEEYFSLATDEKKTITLIPQTVYIEGFAVVRNWQSDSGEFAFARVVYSINNTYQPLKEFKAILKIWMDGGELLDEIQLISLPTLDVGRTEGADFTYIPDEGWQDEVYRYKIELYSQGELFAESEEIEMSAAPADEQGYVSDNTSGNNSLSWPLIGGIIAGAGLIALAVNKARRRTAKG
ncbi:hypothetical protein ACFLUH_01140 [Chloroflexota bacterium]